MQITTEVVSGLERRLNITVPAQRLKTQFDARLKRVAKTIKVNGFRPGKVPLSRVQAEYGQSIQQDVINNCDQCVEIPQFGTKHSFNVSVSAGIVLWELYKKFLLLSNK